MRLRLSLAWTLALLLTTSMLPAQGFLQSLNGVPPGDFGTLQRQLGDWSRTTNLKTTKGWKWLKRWEDFNARRLMPDGSLPDPALYLEAVDQVNRERSAAKMAAADSWFPLGPNDYADPGVFSGWEPGIGRINCIAFHPTDSNTYWVGVAQGGVWKTVNDGQSWTPLTDNLPMLRVSDISVNPVNTNEIYLSVGDYAYLGAGLLTDNRKRHTHYGLGVYKTTDGGASWFPTGLTVAQTDYDYSLTCRVLIHPSNTLTLVAGGTYGMRKSTDAGVTWAVTHDSLIWDIEPDPVDPQVIYASTGYRSSLNAGSVSIMKSTDFGSTWTVLNTGIPPRNAVQRVELAVARSNHNYVYALCAGMDAGYWGMLRSTDAGATWNIQSTTPNILTWDDGLSSGGQGWYDLAIIVDPSNPDRVFTGGINAWGSSDGGVTWDGVSYWLNYYGQSIHADQHQFAHNPLNDRYFVCNDGGLYSTRHLLIGSWYDAANTSGYTWPTVWTKLSSGMQVTSFYRCSTSPGNPNLLLAGAQDNSTYFYNGLEWLNVIGGDGMDNVLHPVDPQTFYGSSQYGAFEGSHDGGLSTFWLNGSIAETGEWTTPIVMHPSNSSSLYTAFGNVYNTTDDGLSWTQISNFPVNPGLGQPNTSSALAIAHSNPDFMYVAKRFNYAYGEGSSLWVTSNQGVSWQDRTAGLPDSLYLTSIAIDHDDPATAYVTAGGFMSGVKVFKTSNAGLSWTNISQNLPNLPANIVVFDPLHVHNPIYVGMDVGVYYTNDTLSGWQLYATDLPNVIVSDLEINVMSQELVAATFGRGLWGAPLKDDLSTDTAPTGPEGIRMRVAPNPSAGSFSVLLEGHLAEPLSIEVIDVMGRKVHQTMAPELRSYREVRIDSDFAPGAYFVRVRAGGTYHTRKVIVE